MQMSSIIEKVSQTQTALREACGKILLASPRTSSNALALLFLGAAGLSASAHADSGIQTTLYSFSPNWISSNESSPVGSLVIGNDGNYYGVTGFGAFGYAGSVYSLTPSGAETQLHDLSYSQYFLGGYSPGAGLVLGADGNFYGTTANGGDDGGGTVFRISPTGSLSFLHSFTPGVDGSNPEVALVQGSDGTLYGTTGGTPGRISGLYPYGTVYAVSPSGEFSTLYGFSGQADGSYPQSLIMGSDGNLYGTTVGGGAYGAGSIFEVSASGAFQTLYSFRNPATVPGDGAQPTSLIQGSDGNFYGTTLTGGANGNGTLFKFTPEGTESIVYSFTASPDGAFPMNLVQGANGNFFGVTEGGGLSFAGTIFEVSPQGQASTLVSLDGPLVTEAVSVGENVNYAGGLLPLPDGSFLGTMPRGGTSGLGSVYTLTVSPSAPAPEVRMRELYDNIYLGQSTTLYWSSIGTTGCTASGAWSGNKRTTGTALIKPTATGTYVYELTCQSSGGPATASVTLNVTQSPPPTLSISANPTVLILGGSTTISWQSSYTNKCTASGAWFGEKPAFGYITYTPSKAGSKVFNLTCTGLGGTASASVTVPVFASVPTMSLGVFPATIRLGSSAKVVWSTGYTTSCTAQGAWSGSVPVRGSQLVTPTRPGSYQYQLVCSDGLYSESNYVWLNVDSLRP
jgi:uncharacterized repeat protein (TIGR03803 family)